MDPYLIHETEHFTISQAESYRIPGYVIIESKTDRTQVAQYGADETADLVRCISATEAVVQELVDPERIYIMKFGEMNPRVHFHVFPRTKRLGDAYAGEVDDAPPYSGARLVDWTWQHHATLEFTDVEIADFVTRARNAFGTRQP
jgi:diadenosine tetraphosphate (Ap4A) HIT family hydrolase